MNRIVEISHRYAGKNLRPGDVAIDATVGNGNDLLFLARIVGPTGRVYGFDFQPDAIRAAGELLTHHDALDRVELIQSGHEHLEKHLPAELHGCVRAVMFNLGYLPGGDKRITTKPETTVAGLHAALRIISPDGVVVVTVYPGHPGGRAESDTVAGWAESLPADAYEVMHLRDMNASETVPWLLVVTRRPPSTSVPKSQQM